MKVIVAGHQKTGTKSMNRALAILGYRVYDFVENCYVLSEEWKKVFKTGGNAELFRKMYENVDAVCDAPSFSFWREIHNAFPESKVRSALSLIPVRRAYIFRTTAKTTSESNIF